MSGLTFDSAGDWRNRRVLITGGIGFIGSNLAVRLAKAGAVVTVLDSLLEGTGAHPFNLDECRDEVRIARVDLRDSGGIEPLIDGQQVIFNLAGRSSHPDSMTDPLGDLEMNCTAQLSLLETCRRRAPSVKIVFTSSRQVYGRPLYLPVDEAHPLAPTDINGIHKLTAERYHLLFSEIYGLRSSVLRLTNIYGPRMRIMDARQNFLGLWVRRVIEDDVFEVWGGDQGRDLTYVDDCVDALAAAALSPATDGQIYNVGGGGRVPLRDLAERLVKIAKGGAYKTLPMPPERAAIDIGDFETDDRRLRLALGWSARTSLEDGLERTIEYYRSHFARYTEPSAAAR